MWGILICLTAPDHVILIFLKVAMNSVSQQEMQELELDVVNACSVANYWKETGIVFNNKSKQA